MRRRVQKKIQPILERYKEQIRKAIQSGRATDELMAKLFDDMRAALAPELAVISAHQGIELMEDIRIGFDVAVINQEAVEWARQYSHELVTGITDTTRRLVNESVATFAQMPGMTRGDLEAMLEPAFGPVRAEMIAVTEVTRAYSQATNQHQARLAGSGIEMRRIWETLNDELVCIICGPLNGAPEEDWPANLKDGPPAHPRCRCGMSLSALDVEYHRAEAARLAAEREAYLRETGQIPPEPPAEPIYGRPPAGPDVTSQQLNKWLMEGLPPDRYGGHIWQDADMNQRRTAKDEIVRELSQRTGIEYEKINEFIHQWAETSNDDDMRSLAIQRDAAEVFGTELSKFTQDKIDGIEQAISEAMARYNRSREDILLGHMEWDVLMPSDQQKSLIAAMRDYTQEQLQAIGYGPDDTIRLRRGVTLPMDVPEKWSVGDNVRIEGNPLESWSVAKEVARHFAYGRDKWGVVFEMDVPVNMIVGSARTGFGCLIEGEFVLQGLPSNAKVIWMQTR